jgi:hypothetical protein
MPFCILLEVYNDKLSTDSAISSIVSRTDLIESTIDFVLDSALLVASLAPSEMNRQSKQIERVCDKVENKISYTCDVKNKCDVLSEIKENETSYMIDNSQTSDKLDSICFCTELLTFCFSTDLFAFCL